MRALLKFSDQAKNLAGSDNRHIYLSKVGSFGRQYYRIFIFISFLIYRKTVEWEML